MKNYTLPNKSVLLTAALLLACPLAASAQGTAPVAAPPVATAPDTASPQTVTLRLKFTPGQTRRFKMFMTMNGSMLTGQSGAGVPMNIAMAMTTMQTVKDVRAADGAATVVTQLEDAQTIVNGKATPLPAAQLTQMKQPITTVVLPTGKVLSVDAASLPTGTIPGMDMSKSFMNSNVSFPDAAVKIGDTWNGTVAMGMAGMSMQTTSTLTKLETKGGEQLATIDQKITGTLATTMSKNMPMTMNMTGTVTGSGTQIFDVTAGVISSQNTINDTDMTMTFAPTAGQTPPAGMPKAMKMKMRQIIQMQIIDPTAPAPTAPTAP